MASPFQLSTFSSKSSIRIPPPISHFLVAKIMSFAASSPRRRPNRVLFRSFTSPATLNLASDTFDLFLVRMAIVLG